MALFTNYDDWRSTITGVCRLALTRAYCEERHKALADEVVHLKTMLEKEHPVFGDRHVEITLIGLKPAREAFAAALEAAFCTDAEVDAWQRGETFSDPWPTELRRVD